MIATRLARVPPLERGVTLGDFLVPIRLGERASSWQRHLLMVTVAVLLIVVGAELSFYLPGNALVPVMLQTFGVLFGSALLGFRRALVAVGLYLVLGIVGLPVFPYDGGAREGVGGMAGAGLASIVTMSGGRLVLGAAGGYLIGFLLAGALVGRLAELGWDRHLPGAVAALVAGNAVVYLVGVPWLAAATQLPIETAVARGAVDFLAVDALKLALAAGLLPAGWWLVRRRSTDL